MDKWNMIIDVALCENCNNCTLSVKDEHVGNDFPGYAAPQPLHGHDWIKINRQVRGETPMVDAAYLPTMCNHCDNAPCIAAANDGSVFKRDDGIVIIDPVKAKGRQDIAESCPYGAIYWNQELQIPQKWIFDAHLIDQGWKQPRCVQVCPTGALRAVKIGDSDMKKLAVDEKLEVLYPHSLHAPRVYYKNLFRFNKCFIGGTIIANIEGVEECVANAKVMLRLHTGATVAEVTTDSFGEFKFDNLEPNSGRYSISVSCTQQGNWQSLVELRDCSVYLGPIQLR